MVESIMGGVQLILKKIINIVEEEEVMAIMAVEQEIMEMKVKMEEVEEVLIIVKHYIVLKVRLIIMNILVSKFIKKLNEEKPNFSLI